MLRRLFRCIVAALLVLSLSLPFAAGQEPPPTIERGVRGDATDSSEKSNSSPNYAFPYALLLIYTLLVLTIVCMPSRKA
jgi:hypothetical protein